MGFSGFYHRYDFHRHAETAAWQVDVDCRIRSSRHSDRRMRKHPRFRLATLRLRRGCLRLLSGIIRSLICVGLDVMLECCYFVDVEFCVGDNVFSNLSLLSQMCCRRSARASWVWILATCKSRVTFPFIGKKLMRATSIIISNAVSEMICKYKALIRIIGYSARDFSGSYPPADKRILYTCVQNGAGRISGSRCSQPNP